MTKLEYLAASDNPFMSMILGILVIVIVIAVIVTPFILLSKLIRAIRSKATQTPLMKAAATGDVVKVKELLSSGVPIDATNAYGRTALSWAIIKNREETAKALIDAGANLFPWESTFALVFESKNERILLWLIEKADAKTLAEKHLLTGVVDNDFSMDVLKKMIEKDIDGAYKISMNENCSDIDQALSRAVSKNNTQNVDFLLANGAGLSDKPLRHAVFKGALPLVKKFIELGDDIEAEYGGNTCLAVAVRWRYYEIAKLLLENKANPNVQVATIDHLNQSVSYGLLYYVKFKQHGVSGDEEKAMASLLTQYGAK